MERPGSGPRAPDEPYTRRVCAILLGDVFGYSALMGEDDERTARAIHELQAAIHDVVTDAKGRADPFAGDAILATFDSVVVAVEAALTIQRRVAETEFAGTRLQMRIGVHFGDVLEREGAAFGDAINVAARLQTLARPGTVCISEGVYRQVRNRFDERFVDLGRQQLKNISDPVHAYLIVPRSLETAHAPARRRSRVRLAAAIGAVALFVVMSAVVAVRYWSTPLPSAKETRSPLRLATRESEPLAGAAQKAAAPAEEGGQVTLGVMVFKSLGPEGEKDWRREALRDGLNAQLSGLSQVKVYSKEFIDFLISRKGLTDIEAATQLGIKKMLSGSFVVVGDTLRVETHVVDVSSGVLEASYTTTESDFFKLQQNMALGVISHLNLPVTEDERRTLLAEQPSANQEALKLLLQAESGAGVRPAAPSKGGERDSPRSELPFWFASLAVVHAAYGDDAPAVQAAIADVIEHYRKATESREIPALAAVYDEFSPEQQAAQQRYFENVRDLKVTIDHVDVAVVGDEAVASYTRTDDFVDARTGRPMHVTVRLTKILRRSDGTWKLVGGK